MTRIHHVIDYFEISVTNMAASRAFYSAAFGWEFNDYGPDYSGIRSSDGESEVGGLGVGRSSGEGGGVLVLLWSDDLDASASEIESAGGTITEPAYEFPGGRRLFFADPDGNRLGVYHLHEV